MRKKFVLICAILTIWAPLYGQGSSVKEVMDNVVSRMYATLSEEELNQLTTEKILGLLTEHEKRILATKYWTFEATVPCLVSVMRHVDQAQVPFWLEPSGFHKTEMTVRNQQYLYEIWQKEFPAGKVELGINGFDKHRPVYFICVGPAIPGQELRLFNVFPENQNIATMENGAFVYHDWDELTLQDVPESLVGHKLFTTIRGRAREAHLIGAFRETPFPSSPAPDQIMLTWSDNPATSQTIQWRTSRDVGDGAVKYWRPGSADTMIVAATPFLVEDRLLRNDRYIHRFTVTLTNLEPATRYRYKVGSKETGTWSNHAGFITAPSGEKPFQFVYFGDTHRSPEWGKLINRAYERHPNTAFYTIGGDIVGTGLYREEWDYLFAYSENVFKNRPLMPTLGNHDDQDGLGCQMFYDLFEVLKNGPDKLPPEKAYSFTYSNALFIMLSATSPVDDQVEWLENQLANSTATWKFAIFHFPPYSYEEDYPDIRKKWGDLFDKYHVDMAMSGHVHYYMRSKPMYNQKPVASPKDGTIYLISIGIPNRAGDFPPSEWVEKRFGGEGLYQIFDISGDKLVMRTMNIDGDVRDELVIEK